MTREIELWDEVYRILTVSMASMSVKVVRAKARGEINLQALMFPKVPDTQKEINEHKKECFFVPRR